MRKEIIIASTNAMRGTLIRHDLGLEPFKEANVGVLMQQEVDRKRDDLERRLEAAGFQLVHESTDLALAIDPAQLSLRSTRTDALQRRRFFGENHVMIAAKLETVAPDDQDNEEKVLFTAATIHPDVFARAHARVNQNRYMARRLRDPFYDGDLVIGGDINHYPHATKRDMRIRANAGLQTVKLDKPTYLFRGSKHAKLRRFPIPPGELDAMMYRGDGIEDLEVDVWNDLESDHGAIVWRAGFNK